MPKEKEFEVLLYMEGTYFQAVCIVIAYILVEETNHIIQGTFSKTL